MLNNIDTPNNISLLSTPKPLNSNSDLIDSQENTPANDSHVAKREEYLNQRYGNVVLESLKKPNYERGLKGTQKI